MPDVKSVMSEVSQPGYQEFTLRWFSNLKPGLNFSVSGILLIYLLRQLLV